MPYRAPAAETPLPRTFLSPFRRSIRMTASMPPFGGRSTSLLEMLPAVSLVRSPAGCDIPILPSTLDTDAARFAARRGAPDLPVFRPRFWGQLLSFPCPFGLPQICLQIEVDFAKKFLRLAGIDLQTPSLRHNVGRNGRIYQTMDAICLRSGYCRAK